MVVDALSLRLWHQPIRPDVNILLVTNYNITSVCSDLQYSMIYGNYTALVKNRIFVFIIYKKYNDTIT